MAVAVAPERIAATAPDDDTLIAEAEQAIAKFYDKHSDSRKLRGTPKAFARRVLNRHRALVKLWGGWRMQWTSSAVLPTLPDAITSEVICEVQNEWLCGRRKTGKPIVPVCLRQYDKARDALYCEHFQCCVPYPVEDALLWQQRIWPYDDDEVEYASHHKVKIRKGQAVTRVVLADVRKRFGDRSPSYVQFWETILERLGTHWSGYRGVSVVLSCAPADFLRLGTYGENSCYRPGGEQERSKFNIAQVPNSVVALFYKTDAELAKDAVRGRAWGILAPKAGGAALTNFYLLDTNLVTPSLKLAIPAALASAPIVTVSTSHDDALDDLGSYAYLNNDVLLFASGPLANLRHEVDEHIATFAKGGEYYDEGRECGCGVMVNNEDARQCADCHEWCCEDCIEVTTCCEIHYCHECAQTVECDACASVVCRSDCGTVVVVVSDGSEVHYCARCAARKALTLCAECGRYTTAPARCALTGTAYCHNCAPERLSSCSRCDQPVMRRVRTRCGSCARVRCDACAVPGETNTPRSECAECQGLV